MVIGKGITRQYSHNKLISWSDKRCVKCKRFISRRHSKFCDRCAIIEHNISTSLERQTPVRHYGMETLYELIEFPIPQYLEHELRNYC